VIFIGFTGYGMMVVLFVQMLMQKSGGFLPENAATAYRTNILGLLLALYPAGQFFGTPIISSLSDRFGRKPVLMVSLAMTTACYVLVALSLQVRSIPMLCTSLFLCGLGESNVAIAQSAIADITPQDQRGRYFGYAYIAIRLGYVLGPVIGGPLVAWTHNDYATPFWVVVGLLLGALVWTALHFKETHPPEPGLPLNYKKTFTNLGTVFTDRPIRTLYLVNFLLYVAIFGFSRCLLMYLVDHWKMDTSQITLFYAYFAAAVLVANLALVPYLLPRIRLKPLAIWSAVLGGLATMLIVVPKESFWLWVTIGPSACLLSVCLSCTGALLSNSVGPERQGSVMGNNEALQVAAESTGAAGGGYLAGLFVQLPLLLFGGMVVIGALLLARVRDNGGNGASKDTAPA